MKRKLLGCSLFLMISAAANAETAMESGGTKGGFKYSDDWQQVSAPPPPGPYQAVTLDPRVPGQKFVLPPSRPAATSSPVLTGQQAVPAPRAPEPPLPAVQAGQPEQGQQAGNWQIPAAPSSYGRPPVQRYHFPYPPRYPAPRGYAPGYGAYRYPAAPYGPYDPGSYQGQASGNQDIPPPGSTGE